MCKYIQLFVLQVDKIELDDEEGKRIINFNLSDTITYVSDKYLNPLYVTDH